MFVLLCHTIITFSSCCPVNLWPTQSQNFKQYLHKHNRNPDNKRNFRARKKKRGEKKSDVKSFQRIFIRTFIAGKNKLQFVQMCNTHDRMIGWNKNRIETALRDARSVYEDIRRSRYFPMSNANAKIPSRDKRMERTKYNKNKSIKMHSMDPNLLYIGISHRCSFHTVAQIHTHRNEI